MSLDNRDILLKKIKYQSDRINNLRNSKSQVWEEQKKFGGLNNLLVVLNKRISLELKKLRDYERQLRKY